MSELSCLIFFCNVKYNNNNTNNNNKEMIEKKTK